MSAAQHRHSTVTSDFILHFSLQPSSNITAVLLISKQLTWKLSMLQEQLSRHAALARLSVHLHVSQSTPSLCRNGSTFFTFWYSSTFLVFRYQTLRQYSDGDPANGTSNEGGMKKSRFSTNVSLCLGNDKRWRWTPIGTRTRSVEWCYFQWPRVISNDSAKYSVTWSVAQPLRQLSFLSWWWSQEQEKVTSRPRPDVSGERRTWWQTTKTNSESEQQQQSGLTALSPGQSNWAGTIAVMMSRDLNRYWSPSHPCQTCSQAHWLTCQLTIS